MTKVKLKNQDAKELFDDFERFEMFVHERLKWLIIGGVGIVAAVAIYGGITYFQTTSESKANSTLGMAQNETELKAALDKYPNHDASMRARLRLAKIYTDEKKYDDALAQYDLVFKSNLPQELRWRYETDIAYVYELKGDLEKAAADFDRIGSGIADESIRREANYAAGRIFLNLKNQTEADKCLKRILEVPTAQQDIWQVQAAYLASKITQPAQVAQAK